MSPGLVYVWHESSTKKRDALRFSMHLRAANHIFHNDVLISPHLRSEILGKPSY